MDSRPATTESKPPFPSSSWPRLSPSISSPHLSTSVPLPDTPVSPAAAAASPGVSHLDYYPILYQTPHAIFQAQLLNYNRLISPSRGGGVGIQTLPLPPVLSSPVVQIASPRSRSSSKSHHNTHNSPPQQQQIHSPLSQSPQNCHGNKLNKHVDKSDRSVTKMSKEAATQKAATPKQGQHSQPNQINPQGQQSQQSQQAQPKGNKAPKTEAEGSEKTDKSDPSPGQATDHLLAKPGKKKQAGGQSSHGQQPHADLTSQAKTNSHEGQQAPKHQSNSSSLPSQPAQSSQSTVQATQPPVSSDRLTARPTVNTRQPTQRSSKSPRPSNKPTGAYANSVPSTPLQHARNFSSESRDPSPIAANGHSPRSAYSETGPSRPPYLQQGVKCRFETAGVNVRRRVPYSVGTDPLETVSPDQIKAKLTEAEETKLTADLEKLYVTLQPTEETTRRRNELVEKLDTIFNQQWPGRNIEVCVFGSSGNKLCSDDSDVDICLKTPWKELENVCMIADILHKRGMQGIVCVASAKVPIVKMWDPELKLSCDINVNNTPALDNTRMILTYVDIDERVRPLAMIIKYWTRRRVINDAAFGATLSSYTWTCMVLCFLQLREVPVLPAIHQRLQDRLPGPDGQEPTSQFADDLSKLRGFGKANKESLGELLFQFFRFYAHVYNYQKCVLSVRAGRLLTKRDKDWDRGMNNALCVEEPFKTERNLANTADDTSFRGLHLEIRRAFDAISEGKLDLCCEQFEYPKEEERTATFTKSAPRPALLRSSSQQHNGRGGRGGTYRGGRQYRNGNSSRRASSSVPYDNSTSFMPHQLVPGMPAMTQELQWYQQSQALHYAAYIAAASAHQTGQQTQQQQQQQQTANGQGSQQYQQPQSQSQSQSQPQGSQTPTQSQPQGQTTPQTHYSFHPDQLARSLSALNMQDAARMHLYAHSQAYAQQQQARNHAQQHAQRIQTGSGSTERSRTNSHSFETSPLSAPMRPDMYMFPMAYFPSFYMPAGYQAQSSPSTPVVASESRRKDRNGPTLDTSSASGSQTPLAQSARVGMTTSHSHGSLTGAAQLNGASGVSHARMGTVQSYSHDDGVNMDGEATPTRGMAEYPTDDDGSQYMGYYDASGGALDSRAMSSSLSSTGQMSDVPTFADLEPPSQGPPLTGSYSTPTTHVGSFSNRRRMSTAEQSPQNVLERRMQRQSSRSPSPLDHNRGVPRTGNNSASSGNGTSTTLAPSPYIPTKNRAPLVVNGSAPVVLSPPAGSTSIPMGRQTSSADNAGSDEYMTNSGSGSPYITHGLGISGAGMGMNGMHMGGYMMGTMAPMTMDAMNHMHMQMAMGMQAPSPTMNGSVSQAATIPPPSDPAASPAAQSPPVAADGPSSAPPASLPHSTNQPAQQSAVRSSVQSTPTTPSNNQTFGQRMASRTNNGYPMPYATIASHGLANGSSGGALSSQKSSAPRPPAKPVAPLDLEASDAPRTSADAHSQHLSPVYETHTPSPTNLRKLDYQTVQGRAPSSSLFDTKAPASAASVPGTSSGLSASLPVASPAVASTASTQGKNGQKDKAKATKPAPGDTQSQQRPSASLAMGNGHVRGAKSESASGADRLGLAPMSSAKHPDNVWQKPKSSRKSSRAMANGHGVSSEQLPKNESERKGG